MPTGTLKLNPRASSISFLLRLRLMTQAAMAMISMRPTRPAKPKTTPDRALFCRKAVGVGEGLGLIVGVCLPDDVKVIVCPATV